MSKTSIVKKRSQHSVKVTMDKLEALVKSKGMSIFARINHRENAITVDMDMNDAEVLIFGNPKGGTIIMNADVSASLDLPLRVAVYADNDDKVFISYHNPQRLIANYGVAALPVLSVVEEALDNLSNAVIN